MSSSPSTGVGRSSTAPGATRPIEESNAGGHAIPISILDHFRNRFEERSVSIDGVNVLVSFDRGLDTEVDEQLRHITAALDMVKDALSRPAVLRLHVSTLGLANTSRLNAIFVGAYRAQTAPSSAKAIDPSHDYFPGLVEYAPLSTIDLERCLAEGSIFRNNGGPVTHELGHVLFNESLLGVGGTLAEYAAIVATHNHITMLERIAGH